MNPKILTAMPWERKLLQIGGTVQGVGFRPFVHRIAVGLGLTGYINNNSGGVAIEIEGCKDAIDAFLNTIVSEAPSIASIDQLEVKDIPLRHEHQFRIIQSERSGSSRAVIPADIAVCDDCLREMFDPHDRRYRYPFTNCTNCGPRFTIVRELPYDRPMTTMARFGMCDKCLKEYHDPVDRRFHAQPNACPVCGPSLWLHNGNGAIEDVDPVEEAIVALKSGKIVALRGIGGFHLAVDATNERAVQKLRERKKRPSRPFALMVNDPETAAEFSEMDEHERLLLVDSRSPIVLLRRKSNTLIARSVSFDNNYYGIMLCYTPLHHLLMRDNFRALVMTSGNVSDEPIAIGNNEALERLGNIADLFLLHDRDILQRADDSIVVRYSSKTFPIRRARGFTPNAVKLPFETKASILACGADLKNCAAIVRGSQVHLTQHIGDLDHTLGTAFYQDAVDHLRTILDVKPDVIAVDLHPDYRSTRWGLRQRSRKVIRVQHHHAHLASVMADNQVTTPTIGIILDGTGYGLDNTIWGGEIIVGDAFGFDRAAWLEPIQMPGGEIAAREPWRMAAAILFKLNVPLEQWHNYLKVERQNLTLVHQMLSSRFNSPMTSSCGRIFDSAAGLLQIIERMEYEAQAAIMLETAAGKCSLSTIEESESNLSSGDNAEGPMPVEPLFGTIIEQIKSGSSCNRIAADFHRKLAQTLINRTLRLARDRNIRQVGLSGGVWQNQILFQLVSNALSRAGMTVLSHRQVPCNDGGISLGQASIAASIEANKGEEQCVWQYPVG